jgi:tRNA 2-thiocytidine biosynthesis protein TtcA
MIREDTYSIVKRLVPEGKTTCSVCSRLRRGILYNAAQELGCTKIALGHHRDDLIESLLMSMLFSGKTRSMPPRLLSDDGRNTVIRPLCYAAEKEIAEFAALAQFPIIPCDLCGSQENLQRKRVKRLLDELERDHPGVRHSLLGAMGNVMPEHLLVGRGGGQAPGRDPGQASGRDPWQASGRDPWQASGRDPWIDEEDCGPAPLLTISATARANRP